MKTWKNWTPIGYKTDTKKMDVPNIMNSFGNFRSWLPETGDAG
jgi:hypothetical protein